MKEGWLGEMAGASARMMGAKNAKGGSDDGEKERGMRMDQQTLS